MRTHTPPGKANATRTSSGGGRKKVTAICLWTRTPGVATLPVETPPPFMFPVFLTGRSSTPELQNSCANFDPAWGEHLGHWRRGPQQQAGRHQHLQFCVWEGDPSPFPCCFGPHLNQTCSLPSNLLSSFLSCFQVSWFAYSNVWLYSVVSSGSLWPVLFIMKCCESFLIFCLLRGSTVL